MKTNYPRIGLAKLCGWFGLSRQAYYQNNNRAIGEVIKEDIILKEVFEIREKHSRLGGRKLYGKLQPFFREHKIKMGRDAFFRLLAENNLLIKKRKSRVHTTMSFHWLRKYPNLIKDFTPEKSNQLWVSDITYWKIQDGVFLYISLIKDAFSHKIVGYNVAETMESIETLQALNMSMAELKQTCGAVNTDLIHHSDRGVQYCSSQYVKVLKNNGIKISMTENGDPRENAIAERVNGILKEEYLFKYHLSTIKQARKILEEVVLLYNQERPHNSIENLTPNQVHGNDLNPKKLWKNYYKERATINQH